MLVAPATSTGTRSSAGSTADHGARGQRAEPQPDTRHHEPHEWRRILVAEELLVEADHAAVHVPQHPQGPVPAAVALVMDDGHRRDEEDLPSAAPETHAPVQVLAVQEVGLVHGANLLLGFPTDEHERA